MKYTKTQLEDVVKNSDSIAEVLRKYDNKLTGGNYVYIKKYIKLFNINCSHFTGQLWSKGKKLGYKHPIEDYFNNNRRFTSHKLKLRLIDEGYMEHKCNCCGLSNWNNKPIPLELHHIDGIHVNNNQNNLMLLCTNCHTQTDNYGNKNCDDVRTIIKLKRQIKTNIKLLNNTEKHINKVYAIYNKVMILLESDIDFTKFGWVKYASKIIEIDGVNVGKNVGRWMKKYVPEFYKQCFNRSTNNIDRINKINNIKEKLLSSDIDFTKLGWVKKTSIIIETKHQKVNKWMKRNMPDFYNTKCFKRKSFKTK